MTISIKFPVLALLAACALPGCTDHAGSAKAKDLEIEIEQLTRLNKESEQTSVRLQAQVEAARQERDQLKAEKAKLKEDRDAAGKEVDELKKQFESYKGRYKLSMMKRAPGMHVEDFNVNGSIFSHVTLKELTDTYIHFSHDAGVAKMSVKLLPEPLQDVLGINIPRSSAAEGHLAMTTDPKQINAARKDEYNRWVAKVETERSQIVEKLAAVRRDLSETRHKINYAGGNGLPVAALNKHLGELLNTIASLEGQLAQASINEYQARKEQPSMLPTPR